MLQFFLFDKPFKIKGRQHVFSANAFYYYGNIWWKSFFVCLLWFRLLIDAVENSSLGFVVCCISFWHDTISNDEINTSRGVKKEERYLSQMIKKLRLVAEKRIFFWWRWRSFIKIEHWTTTFKIPWLKKICILVLPSTSSNDQYFQSNLKVMEGKIPMVYSLRAKKMN